MLSLRERDSRARDMRRVLVENNSQILTDQDIERGVVEILKYELKGAVYI